MRRFALPGLISLIVVALLAVLGFGVAQSGTPNGLSGEVARGHFPVAPGSHLALPLLGTKQHASLASLRGHVVMVDFFAGWCTTCQADAGIVRSSEQMLAEVGGTVLGVTYQDSAPDALGYMHQYHLSYPVLQDVNGTLSSAFDISGVPEAYVIDPQGHVIAADPGELTSSWLKKLANVLSRTA